MALQGNLDSFAVVDVLRLLGSSAKTGRLVVSGPLGTTSLWVLDGDVVGGEGEQSGVATDTAGIAGVMMDLVRADAGTFVFHNGAVPSASEFLLPIEPLVAEAESAVAEWDSLASHVPSMQHVATLRVDLASESVTLDQRLWSAVAAIGAGAAVEQLAARLGLGDVASRRAVHDLLALGLVDLDEPPAVPDEVGDADVSSDGGRSTGGSTEADSRRNEVVGTWAVGPAPLFERPSGAHWFTRPARSDAEGEPDTDHAPSWPDLWSETVEEAELPPPVFDPSQFPPPPDGPPSDARDGSSAWSATMGGSEANGGPESWERLDPAPDGVSSAEVRPGDGVVYSTLDEILGDFDAGDSTSGAAPAAPPVTTTLPPSLEGNPAGAAAAGPVAALSGSDDLARQLALLSPRAAQAVAAASSAEHATIDDEERARLAKFLGSA